MQKIRVKISLLLNYFVFAILLNSVGTVILQVQKNFGVTEKGASILEGCKDITIAITSFLIASYVVKIGYKKTMLIGLGLVSLFCLLMPSLSTFWATKLLFVVVGIGFALIKITSFSTIALVTNNEKEHASFMSYLESFFMIGVVAGNFIFSAFVDNDNETSTQWFKVYYVLSAIAAIAFLLLLSSPINETEIKQQTTTSLKDDFYNMLQLVVIPVVLSFIACAFFYVLIEQSIMSWLPTFNNKVLKLSTTLSIQMASILAASTALGRFFSGYLLKKIKWYFIAIACLVGAAIMVIVAMPLVNNLPTNVTVTSWSNAPFVAFLFPLIGFFLAPIYPAINSVILSSLPKQKHASMTGLIVFFSAIGGTTGSIITGAVFNAFGGQKAFYFSLIPISLLIVFLFFFKKLRNEQA